MKRPSAIHAATAVVLALIGCLPALGAAAGSPVTISGRVWDDEDHDGRRESAEAGIVAQLQLLDASGQVVQTTTSTLPDGAYTLAVPFAGDHRVKVVLEANQKPSQMDDPVVGDRYDSDIDASGVSAPITVGTEDVTHVDAGLELAHARGMVYLERNGMRDWSEGDPLLAGWTVRLAPAVNHATTIAQTVTDEDGEFRILIPAARMRTELTLQIILPTTYGPIDPARDDIDKQGYVRAFFASKGFDGEIAVFRPVRIGDRVWQDKDLDGRQDTGEPGLPNIVVRLMDPDLERTFATDRTDAKGRFKLVAPAPGRYRMVVDMPLSGGSWSPMRTNLPEAVDSDVRPGGTDPGTSAILALKAGNDRTDVDAGMRIRR